jgi:hypothetical protein
VALDVRWLLLRRERRREWLSAPLVGLDVGWLLLRRKRRREWLSALLMGLDVLGALALFALLDDLLLVVPFALFVHVFSFLGVGRSRPTRRPPGQKSSHLHFKNTIRAEMLRLCAEP